MRSSENNEHGGARMRVGSYLTEHGSITEKIAAEELGIIAGSFRAAIYKLREEGWIIDLDRHTDKESVYRLVWRSKVPTCLPRSKFRSYTPDEFRKILVTLYVEMTDWELAMIAMKDFNASRITIYRWLTRGKPITGPAVALADKLIADHNAKTERKP
jgi:hypothetical protein